MRPFSFLRMCLVAPALALAAGCAGTHQARYVYQDGQFGVVGIPENTDRWPTHYQKQAEALMDAHFPEGHEIVRAEEVVEGSRTLTVQGANTAEIGPHLPADLLAVVKLGHTASRSQADSVSIKECRIIYRKAMRPAAGHAYAEVATQTPAPYLDPNAVARQKATGPGAGPSLAAGEPKEPPKPVPAPPKPGEPPSTAAAAEHRPGATPG